jgi:hypothetical protein
MKVFASFLDMKLCHLILAAPSYLKYRKIILLYCKRYFRLNNYGDIFNAVAVFSIVILILMVINIFLGFGEEGMVEISIQ